MDFDLSEEQREIQRTAGELLRSRCGPEAVRAAAEARAEDEGLWREVSELGWPGIAIAAEHGGQGLGMVELAVLAEQAGAALAPIPLLTSAGAALMIAAAGSPEQQARWLPALAEGAARGAVGMCLDGEAGAGVAARAAPSARTAAGERPARTGATDGAAALIAGAPGADVIVLAREDGTARLLEGSVRLQPAETIDLLRPYALGAGEAGEGEPLPGDVAAGVQRVAVAIAAEVTGVCQRALEMTLAYVKERRQFGVPVASFQAVAHRCAEMLLATESARSAVYQGAWAADARMSELPAAASLAKAVAAEAGVSVTASAIQAHGGVGFTWESDVHWLYKRAQMDAQLMGGAGAYRRRIAAEIGLLDGA